MFASDAAPLLFVTMAICGGGTSDTSDSSTSSEVLSPEGWTCDELQLMVDVEVSVISECTRDAQCSVVIPDTGICPTDDLIVDGAYSTEAILWWMGEADAIRCELDFDTEGYCRDAVAPTCVYGRCAWR